MSRVNLLIVVFIMSLLLAMNYAHACSCSMSDSGNADKEIQTMGNGFWFTKNGKNVFKFVTCVNRPGCPDIELPQSNENDEKARLYYSETMSTKFNTFEEAIEYDKKENLIRDEKRKAEKDKKIDETAFHCRCPIPRSDSIFEGADYTDHKKLVATYGIETHKDYQGCPSCEKLNELYKLEYAKNKLNGKLYIKDDQLYFEAKARKDSRVFRINQNFKCAPLLKEFLDQDIRLYSNHTLISTNDSIDMLNTCEVKISKEQYLDTSTFTEEEYQTKNFAPTASCKKPIYNANYLSNAKTILFIRHATNNIRDKFFILYTIDVLKKTIDEQINIIKDPYVKQFGTLFDDVNIDYAFISTDKVKIDSSNIHSLTQICNSVILLADFPSYNQLRGKYPKTLNTAEAEIRYQKFKANSPTMSEEMLLRQSGKKR